MHSWTRPQEPDELRDQCVALTRAFMDEHHSTGKTPHCKWPKVMNNAGVMITLQELLSYFMKQHCSYCDGWMGDTSRDTIDHFLPKKEFPHLAYEWSNLYLCCDGCQRKGIDYDPDHKTLRPDESGYQFSSYFRYERNGRIKVTAIATADKERAEITIDVLRLNREKLIRDRKLAFHQHALPRRRPVRPGMDAHTANLWFEAQTQSVEDKPYRDFFAQDRQN